MIRNLILLFTVSTLSASLAHAQNLLKNGSFESPVIEKNTVKFGAIPEAWTWDATPAALFNGKVSALWPAPYEGLQFVDIGNGGVKYSLSQTFTVTNDRVYVLRWFDSTAGGSSPYTVTVLKGAVAAATTNLNAFHAEAWRGHTLRLRLGSGIHTIRFSSAGGVFDTLIDDVSLEPMPDDDLLASIRVSAVDICWRGRPEELYQVQFCTNLQAPIWIDFGSPVAGSGSNCVNDVVGGQPRYYRVTRVL